MPFLLQDAIQLLQDRNAEDTSSRAQRDYATIANGASGMLRRERCWSFDRRAGYVTFQAPISLNGVSTTGGGTLVQISDFSGVPNTVVGSCIQFNQLPDLYNIAYWVNANLIVLARPFLGASLDNVPANIICPRAVLPANWRQFEQPFINQGWWKIAPSDLSKIMQMTTFLRQQFYPEVYAVEENDQGYSVGPPATYTLTITPIPPLKWLWVYPAPSALQTITIQYYCWPVQAVEDTDGFGLPDTPLAAAVMWEYMLAMLLQQQNRSGEYNNQLALADKFSQQALGSFAPMKDAGDRRLWSASGQSVALPFSNILAPGVLS